MKKLLEGLIPDNLKAFIHLMATLPQDKLYDYYSEGYSGCLLSFLRRSFFFCAYGSYDKRLSHYFYKEG